jgi:hypothetical protein
MLINHLIRIVSAATARLMEEGDGCETPEAGVLDEPDSAKPAQRSSFTGPPGYIGWTQFQPM